MNLTADEKMTKAKVALVLDQPFFGSLALRLEFGAKDFIPTASTNGKVLWYNPGWIDELDVEQCKGLIAHEVMHCACQHHLRMGPRRHDKWNFAADYAIDPILKESGFKLPDESHILEQYKGMNAEQIYNLLSDGPDQQNESSDNQQGEDQQDESSDNQDGGESQQDQQQDPYANRSGGNGEVMEPKHEDGSELTPAEEALEEQDWQINVAQAAQTARVHGKMPGGLERLVGEILEHKIDWREVLRNFIEKTCYNDYSWLVPNRRYINNNIILPSLHSKEVGEIIVCVDTSGSISQDELDQFSGEVSGILEEFDMDVEVYYVDTRINGEPEHYTREDMPIQLRARGGGGTNFRPVFEHLEKEDRTPKALIYFTDLWCNNFPDFTPDYPTLWICTDSDLINSGHPRYGNVPFGEVLPLNVGDLAA